MKKIIAIILITIVVTTFCACAGGEDNSAKIKELQQQIEQLQTSLNQNADKIEYLEKENATLKTEISKLEEENETLKQEVSELESQKATWKYYTLKEAYDNGWLTQEDLLSIAYYHHEAATWGGRLFNEELMGEEYEPMPKVPENLSGQVLNEIKQAYINKFFSSPSLNYQYTVDNVDLGNYYGMYNGCVATAKPGGLHIIHEPIIGGVKFRCNDGYEVCIWRKTL